MPDDRPSVLLVEDDEALGRQVVQHLTTAGLRARWITNGSDALDERPDDYSLLVLDLMLPGAHGFEVLKRFRESSDVPVLILSARNETPDKVRALGLGADDYLTKPFWPDELLARVRARLRRPTLHRADTVTFGEATADLTARRVVVGEADVDLTRVEFDLLAALARRPGVAVSRAWLVDHVLDPDREGGERTLDVHVSRLRRKLGVAGASIVTVWGVGYRLDTSSPR
jgi:two-component system response regulator MtrA